MNDAYSPARTGCITSDPAAPIADEDQKKFCAIEGGRIRLLAPAGCGKTSSILWRCMQLAEKSPLEKPKFLLFTFTRAACEEIKTRLHHNKTFAPLAPLITVTTLNSWGYRYLKLRMRNPKLITGKMDRRECLFNLLQPLWIKSDRFCKALSDNRKKYQAAETIMGLNDTLKALGFRHDKIKVADDIKAQRDFLEQCGMINHFDAIVKNITELEIIKNPENPNELLSHYFSFWSKATETLYRSAILTLEDQKYWAQIELEYQLNNKQFTSGGGRYHYVMVDEFQDINPLDLRFLNTIAEINKAELTIVGDDDQAIYEWRGATPSFILEPETYLNAEYETCILGTNYRSPKNIVEISQKLIAHNKRRVPKHVVPASQENAIIEVKQCSDLNESISFTLDLVNRLLDDKSIRNIALIGRKRSQIIPYQIVFAGQKIPFNADEDLQIFLSDAFKRLKEILTIRASVADFPNINRDPIYDLMVILDSIGRYRLSRSERDLFTSYLRKNTPSNISEITQLLINYDGNFKGSKNSKQTVLKYADIVLNMLLTPTVSETLRVISQNFAGMQKDYGKSIEDIFYTDPPFLHLIDYAKRYEADFNAFLQDIEKAIETLASPGPDDDENESDQPQQRLHLMTALRAKGKEFDAVVVLDTNGGIWPGQLASSETELEQERRLFYVAITRARKQLYLLVNDQMLEKSVMPSPYLAEMGMDS